jgi:hypothetical protein
MKNISPNKGLSKSVGVATLYYFAIEIIYNEKFELYYLSIFIFLRHSKASDMWSVEMMISLKRKRNIFVFISFYIVNFFLIFK